jgi:hypothetical protein
MSDRLAELGALQDAVSNTETNPARLSLAGYIRGLFLDWSKNPSNPLSRLTVRGRYFGYFWDNGIMPLSLDFANQNFVSNNGGLQARSFSDIVTFSRTSNATVTRADGTIGYAPHNLLTFSEQFDNAAWAKGTATSITANNATDPNGTTTAELLGATTTGKSFVSNSVTLIAIPYVFSVYAKKANSNFIQLRFTSTLGSWYANFDLNLGEVGNYNTTSAGIENIGNDWYRCFFSTTPTAATGSVVVQLANSKTSPYDVVLGSASASAYLWGAQLEIGSTATTYNPTTVKNLLGFTEAFDNAAWTKSNSFVQTNLLTYSEDFSNVLWVKTTTTVATNTEIAPNGYQTADTLTATNSNSTTLDSYTATAVPHTFSVWLKRKTGTGNIDLTVDGTTYVTRAITTDWTRVETTLTPSAGTRTCGIRIATSGDEVFVWGAQLVQGSVAGDYRRTDASALPVFYANHNGVVCAEKLVEDTSGSAHRLFVTSTTIVGTPYTASVYAKEAERRYFTIRPELNASVAIFDLRLGTVVSVTAGITASIIAVGNGYYRCSATKTAATTTWNTFICPADGAAGSNTYTGDGTSGIYIFGAQLSDSASLDPYVLNAGTAPTAQAYYAPRFDYDPVTLQPKGLLIEEQRSNLLLNSSIAGTNLATQNVTVTAVAHTLSFYGTGTVTLSGTATATVVGTGAYPARTTLTFTPTAGTLTVTVSGTVQYAQLEIGAFVTSYIPTVASQVTRTADVATIQGSNFYSWYNQNEGSTVVNVASFSNTINRGILQFESNSTNYIKTWWGGSGNAAFVTVLNTSSQANITIAKNTLNTFYKMANTYKVNDFMFYVDSLAGTPDTLGDIPITTQLKIGVETTVTGYLNGHIKQISYYDIRLSNDVLQGLTA